MFVEQEPEQQNQQDPTTTHTDGDPTLMGSRPGQLNLNNVRMRAMEMIQILDEMLYVLRVSPSSLHWNDVVDKMAVLNVQIQQLQDQIRPVSQHYVVHPKSVNQQNSVTLPIMLASRLYPEQQRVYDDVYYAAEVEIGDDSWKGVVDDVCSMLTGKHGLLDPRGPARRRLASDASTSIRQRPQSDFVAESEEYVDILSIVGFGGTV